MAPKRKAQTAPTGADAAADGHAKAAADATAKKAKAPAGSDAKPRPKKARKKIRYTVRKKSAKKTVDAVKKVEKAEHADESAEPEKVDAPEHVTVGTAKVVSKRLIIEHCKQCTSFKNQAARFEKSLKEKIEGLEVSINPDKPRRGCFEVRDADGNAFLTLLDLKRPFPELKALNVEEQVEIIVSKIK